MEIMLESMHFYQITYSYQFLFSFLLYILFIGIQLLRTPVDCSWVWRSILKLRISARPFILSLIGNGHSTFLWFDNWVDGRNLSEYVHQVDLVSLGLPKSAKVKDIFVNGNCRPPSSEVPALNSLWREVNEKIHICEQVEDEVVWSASPSGAFTISSAVKVLKERRGRVDWSGLVWFKHHIPRQSFITWLTISGGLLTQDKMVRMGMLSSSHCILCRNSEENEHHLFFDCTFSAAAWHLMLIKLGFNRSVLGSIEEACWIVDHFTGSDTVAIVKKLAFNGLVYRLWLERNSRRFKNVFSSPESLVHQVIKDIRLKLNYRHVSVLDCERNRSFFGKLGILPNFERLRITKCIWVKPEAGWFALNCDGSLKSSLGGLGGLVRDREGGVVVAFAAGVNPAPIFALEILAIEHGLKLAIEHQCLRIQIYSDSLQAVEVIKGNQIIPWRVKESLRCIKESVSKLEMWRITHVFRECNKPADFLAGYCNVVGEVVMAHDGIPDELNSLVNQDSRGCTFFR